MALPIVRVALRATQGTNEIVNTLHYRMTPAGGDVADYQALADWFRDHVIGPWADCIIPSWSVQPVTVIRERDPADPSEAREEYSSGAPTPGTRLAPPSSEVLPLPACALLRLTTGFTGRSRRGRLFLPPLWSDAQIDNGVVSGTQLAKYQAFADAIPLDPSPGDIGELVVFSRTLLGRAVADYYTKVTAKTVDTTVRWLRRRAS